MSDEVDPVVRRLRASASEVGDGVSVDSVARGVRARRDARRRAAGALVVMAVVAPVSWAILTQGGNSSTSTASAGAASRENDRVQSAPKDASADAEGGAQQPQPQVAGAPDCPPLISGTDASWVPLGTSTSAGRLVPTSTPAAARLCSYTGVAGVPGTLTLARSVEIRAGLGAIATDLNALPTAAPRPCPSPPSPPSPPSSGSANPARYLLHLRYADGSDAWVGMTDACGGFTIGYSTTSVALPADRLQAVLATGRWR